MAAELGAEPVLCGFIGGEVGTVLRPFLEEMPVELRLVETAQPSGAYIHDRRSGGRQPISQLGAFNNLARSNRLQVQLGLREVNIAFEPVNREP